MAAVGAGTTGFYTSSTVFSSKLFHHIPNRYRVAFSHRALKQTQSEERIHEYEYLTMRRRAYWRRYQAEKNDVYKRRAIKIQPWGVLVLFVAVLVCCCAFIEEWSRTFPLGNITKYMDTLKPVGLLLVVIGLALIAASHLCYYKSETGTWRRPMITFKPITLQQARQRQIVLTCTERIHCYAHTVFRLGAVGLITGSLLICVGFIPEWSNQFPGGVSASVRRVLGYIGIYGTVTSVVLMIACDLLITWIEENKLIRQPADKRPVTSMELRTHEASNQTLDDAVLHGTQFIAKSVKYNSIAPSTYERRGVSNAAMQRDEDDAHVK